MDEIGQKSVEIYLVMKGLLWKRFGYRHGTADYNYMVKHPSLCKLQAILRVFGRWAED